MSKSSLKVLIAVALIVGSLTAMLLAQAKWYQWMMTDDVSILRQYTDAIAGACVLATLSIVSLVSAVISYRNYEC